MKVDDTVIHDCIRSWKIVRLHTGHHVLGYPATNILHPTHGVGTARPVPGHRESDAGLVQQFVEKMPAEIRECFEAYHIGLIRGEFCKWPQRARINLLGINRDTYYKRVNAGFEFLRDHLTFGTLGDKVPRNG